MEIEDSASPIVSPRRFILSRSYYHYLLHCACRRYHRQRNQADGLTLGACLVVCRSQHCNRRRMHWFFPYVVYPAPERLRTWARSGHQASRHEKHYCGPGKIQLEGCGGNYRGCHTVARAGDDRAHEAELDNDELRAELEAVESKASCRESIQEWRYV